MKRRIRKIVNFFAFNLLFFALYLNFIHKDKSLIEATPVKINAASAITGNIPVPDPEKYVDNKNSATVTQPVEISKADQSASLKLTIN